MSNEELFFALAALIFYIASSAGLIRWSRPEWGEVAWYTIVGLSSWVGVSGGAIMGILAFVVLMALYVFIFWLSEGDALFKLAIVGGICFAGLFVWSAAFDAPEFVQTFTSALFVGGWLSWILYNFWLWVRSLFSKFSKRGVSDGL